MRRPHPRLILVMVKSLVTLLVAGLVLAACGDSTPTAKPTATPTLAPVVTPPLAWLAEADFNFADQAEKAERDLVNSRPNFPAYATWTVSNRWYLMVRDSNTDRLIQQAGKDARITPVTYVGEALPKGRGTTEAYALDLNRTTVDVKAGGAKEAAQILFNRAVRQQGIQDGLLVFTLGSDQIYILMPSSVSAEQALALTSMGKVEIVSAGTKNLAADTIITTSASPSLGTLKLKDTNVYDTLAENSDFASFAAGPAIPGSAAPGVLKFELRSGAKVFDYTRANQGKYAALVFDHQVLSSAVINAAIKDRGQMQVPRWAGSAGQADMQRFIDLMNANPPQIFEAKELDKSPGFVYSGSFTH